MCQSWVLRTQIFFLPGETATIAVRVSKLNGQIGYRLSNGLHLEGLVIHKPVVLRLHPSSFYQHLGVGGEAREGKCAVAVDLNNLLNGSGFHEGRGDALLDGEHNALGGDHTDGRRAKLDGLDRIFNLSTNWRVKFR